MNTTIDPGTAEKRLTKTVLAFKAARLSRGLTRKQAAELCGCSPRSFEQLENGRCNFSEARLRRLLEQMSVQWSDFLRILEDPKKILARVKEHKPNERSLDRKPRRNHFKIVTKEVRVIRILRKRKGISQYEASRLCGYVPGGFGHIEVGRIELSRQRIDHILSSLGYVWSDFEALMKASVLRDELIEDCTRCLHHLDDSKLESATNILKALNK